MQPDKRYASLAASVCFLAFVAFLFSAILYGLVKEWRAYCVELHASADWLDCDNWGYDCEDIA
jgi:hypothetical protein